MNYSENMEKIILLITKRSVEVITQEQQYSQRCLQSSFLVTVYVRFVRFLDCCFSTIKYLCFEMFVREGQADR